MLKWNELQNDQNFEVIKAMFQTLPHHIRKNKYSSEEREKLEKKKKVKRLGEQKKKCARNMEEMTKKKL